MGPEQREGIMEPLLKEMGPRGRQNWDIQVFPCSLKAECFYKVFCKLKWCRVKK